MEGDSANSVVVRKFGGYDCVVMDKTKLPPLDDKIEVKVEYGGLNFADIYTRKGLFSRKLPFILGMECSGTVTAIGPKNTDSKLKVGQRVICYDVNGGMFSDIIRVPEDKCYNLPEHVDFKNGAAIFVNYLTAYFAVMELGHLKRNEKLLILSCTGGVGVAATQLAKTVDGCRIYGTGSKHKKESAEGNGVHTFYSNDTFTPHHKCDEKFDLIVSNESGEMFTYLRTLLKPLGRIVLLGTNNIIRGESRFTTWTLLKAWWTAKNISMFDILVNNQVVSGLHLGTLLEQDRGKVVETLEAIFELMREGKIEPKISVYPMSEIVEATRMLAERKNVGKVLLSMQKILYL